MQDISDQIHIRGQSFPSPSCLIKFKKLIFVKLVKTRLSCNLTAMRSSRQSHGFKCNNLQTLFACFFSHETSSFRLKL